MDKKKMREFIVAKIQLINQFISELLKKKNRRTQKKKNNKRNVQV